MATLFFPLTLSKMDPRKNSKSTGHSNVSKGGRPSTFVETHPELLTNYMELKPMVYDNLNLPDENEITRLIRDFNGHFNSVHVEQLIYIKVAYLYFLFIYLFTNIYI